MDKSVLINNISQLSDETIYCLKLLDKATQIFTFDTETHEDLEAFMNMMKIKALRISNPRDKKDITNNIKRKEVYANWQTTETFNDFRDNQQDI